MKLLLVDHKNSNDINQFSGTSFFMRKAIRNVFEDVQEFSILESIDDVRKVIQSGIGAGLKPFGDKLTKFLNESEVKADFVLCQGGNTAVPYYRHATPLAYWHDSTWHSFLQGYRSRKAFDQFKKDYRNLFLWDQKAFDKADLLIFSSDYVAEACKKYYNVSHAKVKVISFGANLNGSPEPKVLDEFLTERIGDTTLNFTFIGKDWKRKGLSKAILLVRKLNENGIGAHLNVIGCEPNLKYLDSCTFITIYGFLDKSKSSDAQVFENLLQRTHFLLHPTLAEPFGIVLCEANAYGIPVLGTNTEGLKSIIEEGKNGYLFKRTAFVKNAYELLMNFNDNFDVNYKSIFTSSIMAYQSRLNWETNVLKLKTTLQQFS